jgi:hypothetical protein
MYERFSPSARRVIQLSNQSCQRFDHYFEPGTLLPLHVLDGILQTPWGGAADIFAHLIGDASIVRNAVVESLSKIPGAPGAFMGKIPQAYATRVAIESAIRESADRKCTYVGTEHLLIGIARLTETEPATSLLSQWFDLNAIQDHLWVINYDSIQCQSSWREYCDWYQWSPRIIDANCLKTALALAPAWKAQFGCRLDDAIDLLDCAIYHEDCPDELTADWLVQFANERGNENSIGNLSR